MRIGFRSDSRAASRALNVPSALDSKSSLGLVTDVVTATCPARWTMTSASLADSDKRSASRRSPMRSLNASFPNVSSSQAMLRGAPARDKLS